MPGMKWIKPLVFQKVPETLSADGRTDGRTDIRVNPLYPIPPSVERGYNKMYIYICASCNLKFFPANLFSSRDKCQLTSSRGLCISLWGLLVCLSDSSIRKGFLSKANDALRLYSRLQWNIRWNVSIFIRKWNIPAVNYLCPISVHYRHISQVYCVAACPYYGFIISNTIWANGVALKADAEIMTLLMIAACTNQYSRMYIATHAP